MLFELVAAAEAAYPDDDWHTAVYRGNLGQALNELGRHDEAESYLLRAFEVFAGVFGRDHIHTRAAAENLTTLYERMGQPEKGRVFPEFERSAFVKLLTKIERRLTNGERRALPAPIAAGD